MRRHESRISPFAAGLLALGLIVIGTYFAFAKALPFGHHYEVRAVVSNANLLAPRSPVRIAGVEVGEVVGIGRYRNTKLALVTLRIRDNGRPLHRDATIKIRPRLFLEGNFYVDMKPGTPAGGELPDGGVIPLHQTSRPVQIDEVLSTLPADVRASLQDTLQGFDAALNSRRGAGPSGAEALNRTLGTSEASLRDSAVVAQALVGPGEHALSKAIDGFGRAARALAENDETATALVSDLNTTMAALAERAPDLQRAVALLGPTAVSARDGFGSLARALPPTRRFARELVPGVRATPATIDAAGPWLRQAQPLLGDDEFGGLLKDLKPLAANLGGLEQGTRRFLPPIDRFARCITGVVLPSGNVKIDDGPLSSGVENYKELWYAMVAQAAEGAGFDGNGSFLRLAAAPGTQIVQTGKTNYAGQSYFSTAARLPLRTRPAYTAKLPPLRRDVPCFRNPVPDVNGPGATGPADGSAPNAPAPKVEP